MKNICKTICFLVPALVLAQATSDQQSRDASTHVNPNIKVDIPKSYALVIGISTYQYLPQKNQLKYSTADAAAIYTTLISPEAGQFPAENVHRLIGRNATLANIRHELEEWLPSVTTDDDRVLIYFAGHGIAWKDGKVYLAPYDVKIDDVGHTAYPMDRLGEVFGGKIKGKWRVLLTDACHSGAVLPATDVQVVNDRLKSVAPSVFSLTASRAREVSYESSEWGGGHGAFTYYVVKGLEGAADRTPRDGEVTADELADYVYTSVREATQGRKATDGTLLSIQNPMSGQSADPNMLLAYDPTTPRIDTPKPDSKSATLVIVTNRDGTEIFLDGKSQGVADVAKPLRLSGIAPGVHRIQGVRMPYVPFGPTEETVFPGQTITINIRLTIIRRASQPAMEKFDRGLVYYTDGKTANYEKAVNLFEEAFALDPSYSRAALFLGRTYNALGKNDLAEPFFRKAIDIDPDFEEARDSFASTLMEKGDFQGAIQQLNAVVQRNPDDGMAHYMLCTAFTRIAATEKNNSNALQQGLNEGRESVRLLPNKGEPHLWLADALRLVGNWGEAKDEYSRYLALTDFDSSTFKKTVVIILIGRTTRASQHDIWMKQRGSAYFGLCDCDRALGNLDAAIPYCQKSLTYDPQDAFSHVALGMLFVQKYNRLQNPGLLIAGRKHLKAAAHLIPNTDEAAMAQRNIARIDAELIALQSF